VEKRSGVTFEAILKQGGAAEAWACLQQDVPEDDLKPVKHLLEALTNREPSFAWNPPDPRDARRFADHLLEQDVPKVRRMKLYFGLKLPLGDRDVRDLPEILKSYARALKTASRSRPKQRPTNQSQDHEIEIIRLLDQSVPDQERHHYGEAAALIQAAYNAGGISRTVDETQLRKLYDRQSFRFRLKHRNV
jgi:uncharacterized protein YbaA (DUF1428 family)